jgi:O-antigen/teichoic acid export membrane protein
MNRFALAMLIFVELAAAAVLAVALPALCRATTTGPLLRLSAGLTVAATALAAVLWLAGGTLVPLLFGGAYAASVPAFRILLLAFPLMSLNYALTHQLIGWQGHRAYAAACAAALAFNLALNLRMIPAAGILGAAWTTVWTEVVITLVCGIALARLDPAGLSIQPASQAAQP